VLTTKARNALRCSVIVGIDGLVISASFFLSLTLRFQGQIPQATQAHLTLGLITIVAVSLAVFYAMGLYRRVWRYVSIADLAFLLKTATAATVAAVITLFVSNQSAWVPTSVPVIHWFIAVVGLGSVRVIRRSVRERLRAMAPAAAVLSFSTEDGVPRSIERNPLKYAIIVGATDWAETMLPLLGRFHNQSFVPVGLVDHHDHDVNLKVHGVPMLGSLDELEAAVERLARMGKRPQCLIVNASDTTLTGAAMVNLVSRAERLGLEVARAPDPSLIESHKTGPLNLEFLNFTDLLGRSELNLDANVVASAIYGRRVMVTGAGGTIGGELVRQLAAFKPSELILLDNGEYNLYAIDLEMRESYPDMKQVPVLCSIRQRDRVMQVFAEHRPEMVFHAAALKHVPLVEVNPCSGVQTNVLGTRNIADAARRYGVKAMVQVSTDKAVNPVGMMGATKRLGELYCQALDLAGVGNPNAPRFMTVRFGNVLGSSGSLIPLFQRQLSRRGPLTVTHPDIERFFMTVHEAVQLILHSSADALKGKADRGRIFVLDMGKPIKIVEIAKRMIRLAGLEPDLDIKIDFVGLRPGEKLYEELFDESEARLPSSLAGIFEAQPDPVPLPILRSMFHEIERSADAGDTEAMCKQVRSVIDYHHDQKEKAVPPFALAGRATGARQHFRSAPVLDQLIGAAS
jgi:FlaA1/EpsC-like NDP-sugar epimerase